uniref:Uncharacterized protein n=1 Tax=Caenorhabditis japonica TaxID=281687 RepID=A0A8R1EJJ2_CAEJA
MGVRLLRLELDGGHDFGGGRPFLVLFAPLVTLANLLFESDSTLRIIFRLW